MVSKRFVAASAVAFASLTSCASRPPIFLQAADSSAQVPQTRYVSALSTYGSVVESHVSPDKLWKEANAVVGNEGNHEGPRSGSVLSSPDAECDTAWTMTTQGPN